MPERGRFWGSRHSALSLHATRDRDHRSLPERDCKPLVSVLAPAWSILILGGYEGCLLTPSHDP